MRGLIHVHQIYEVEAESVEEMKAMAEDAADGAIGRPDYVFADVEPLEAQ